MNIVILTTIETIIESWCLKSLNLLILRRSENKPQNIVLVVEAHNFLLTSTFISVVDTFVTVPR